jgi:hypothetical protein
VFSASEARSLNAEFVGLRCQFVGQHREKKIERIVVLGIVETENATTRTIDPGKTKTSNGWVESRMSHRSSSSGTALSHAAMRRSVAALRSLRNPSAGYCSPHTFRYSAQVRRHTAKFARTFIGPFPFLDFFG